MRKRIVGPVRQQAVSVEQEWLNLEALAEAEITSEDSAHPIEHALLPGQVSGWRASSAGKQTIRLVFAHPQEIRRILLHFVESSIERTQELVLRWSSDDGQSFREVVRQQWNFSPEGSTAETEDLHVELPAVTVLELSVIPDISGGTAVASLEKMRIA